MMECSYDSDKKTPMPTIHAFNGLPMPMVGNRMPAAPGSDLEVEVYYRVSFHIKTWDGQRKLHQADLPGHVRVKDLKEELEHELGDPKRSDWVVSRTQTPLADDMILHNTDTVDQGENIEVLVHRPLTQRD